MKQRGARILTKNCGLLEFLFPYFRRCWLPHSGCCCFISLKKVGKLKKVSVMKGITHFINIFIILLSISSCGIKNREIAYVYGTPAFNEKQKALKYTVSDASGLCADYLRQQGSLSDFSWLTLNIIYGDYYVFKTRPAVYNLKLAEYYLSGIWVNGQTGEVKNVEKGGKIRVVLEHPKHIPFVYRLSGIPEVDMGW